MKKILLTMIAGLALLNVGLTAQPSVFDYAVDTSLYEKSIVSSSYFYQGLNCLNHTNLIDSPDIF